MKIDFFFPLHSGIVGLTVEGTPPPVGSSVCFNNTTASTPKGLNFYGSHKWVVKSVDYLVKVGVGIDHTYRAEVHLEEWKNE